MYEGYDAYLPLFWVFPISQYDVIQVGQGLVQGYPTMFYHFIADFVGTCRLPIFCLS